jgi:acyl-CoA dehydrogenase
MMAPHPAASLTFHECRIPATHLIGDAGNGFKVAMSVFDIFRTSVGGAAVVLHVVRFTKRWAVSDSGVSTAS